MDFQTPAGLYIRRKSTAMGRPPAYRRFSSLALAVRYAVEEQKDVLNRCTIECGDHNLDHQQIQAAYDSRAGQDAMASLETC